MVEQIADPLVHLIRNACDHGVEPADARARAGRPPEATVRLSAYHEGGSIVIELSDDGRGLDREAIVGKALRQGLIRSADGMSEADIDVLIFAPGFSTAKVVTEVSGRGVGMDVVRRNVEALRGRVTIHSRPGHGTTFKLVLPLTLAIIDGLLVRLGVDSYIIPPALAEECLALPRTAAERMGRRTIILVRGEMVPALLLRIGRFAVVRIMDAVKSEACHVTLAERVQALDVIHQLACGVDILLLARERPMEQARIRILALGGIAVPHQRRLAAVPTGYALAAR